MLRLPPLLACASLGYLGACDSDNGHATLGADAAFETGSRGTPSEMSSQGASSEAGSEGASSEAGNDAFDGRVEPPSHVLPEASTGTDAGLCTASIDTFNCPSNYPSRLGAACGAAPAGLALGSGVSTAECGSLPAIVYGGPPHYSFCVYQGVDAGALVGAQRVTDFPELCNNTSEVITGGQVPAACNNNSAIYLQLGLPDSGSITVLCDGGGAP